jgi:hypothetical protein
MIGVPTHGFISGHSMPPTLPKSPQIEYIYKNIIKKYIFQRIKIFVSKKLLKKYWLKNSFIIIIMLVY